MNVRTMFQFWKHFLSPYFYMLIPLVGLNILPGLLLSLRPLVLAPVLGRVLPNEVVPATSIFDVSLDNIGATIQAIFGIQTSDMGSAFFMSGVLYLIGTVLIATLGGVASIASMSIRLNVLKDMTIALHSHLITLHLGYHLRQRSGETISRFSMDLAKTASLMETIFSGLTRSGTQLFIFVLILFQSAPVITYQILILGSLHMVITRVLGGKVKRLTLESYDTMAEQTATIQESFQNIRIIKSFCAEHFNKRELLRNVEAVRKVQYNYMVTRYLEEPVRLFADGLVIVAILPIAYRAISRGDMSLAGITLYFYIASQLVIPISEISRQVLNVFGMQGGFTRLVEIFRTQNEIRDGKRELSHFKDEIKIENVHFHFDNVEVLRDVNLLVKKGETVGIVGESGGGKSTLVDLILRLYDPVVGKIMCDGEDLRTLTQKSYRSMFGIVTQECLLFNSSLEENIAFGRPIVRENLERACKIANLEDFVNSLPAGLKTEVGDRGARLSGGQRQRVAIARAVYGSPEILILDEATSALDTVSEREVQKAISEATKNITSIIIAHRLSTVTHADKIVVMSNGSIEAIGRHEELLESCRVYRWLLSSQAGSNVDKSFKRNCK